MKSIDTLIPDIYELLKKRDGSISPETLTSLSEETTRRLKAQLSDSQSKGTLRLSAMGPRCPRALWYMVRHPEMAEQLPPWATFKYMFGHIVEAMVIALAKATGHTVEGEQDAIILDGIVGHRDCVIDGCIVDVKSSSSRSYIKFKDKSIAQSDTFGYLDQLDGYVIGSVDDPLVKVKDKGYLFAVDKQLGHMCLYKHEVTDARQTTLRDRIAQYKSIVGEPHPPACECGTIRQGASGNIQLDLKASYSPFKYCCRPHLRTFLYANGPVYLTKVIKRPTNANGPIREVDKDGHVVYN
jgi:hypothetical protein